VATLASNSTGNSAWIASSVWRRRGDGNDAPLVGAAGRQLCATVGQQARVVRELPLEERSRVGSPDAQHADPGNRTARSAWVASLWIMGRGF
jgi:hypothetical protein